jgi:hypothetical protein
MKQMRFAMLDLQNKTKHTKRERFLAEMNVVMAWALLITLIEQHLRQLMTLEQTTEIDDGRFVGDRVAAKLETGERAHRLDVVGASSATKPDN